MDEQRRSGDPLPASGELLRLFSELSRRKESGTLSLEETTRLHTSVDQLLDQAELVLVTADPQFSDIHAQLTGQDKIHPLPDHAALVRTRLGNAQESKRCYALAVPDTATGTRKVLAAIYTFWSPEETLPGNVAAILAAPSAPVTLPKTVTFYSVSSFFPKAGKVLIERLHAQLCGQGLTLTTLSPLRTLKEVFAGTAGGGDLKGEALRYLLQNRDPVEQFHLGNGAYIGNIALDANTPDTDDALHGLGVMVNYVYDSNPQQLAKNRDLYRKQQRIIISDALYLSVEGKTPALSITEASDGRYTTPAPRI